MTENFSKANINSEVSSVFINKNARRKLLLIKSESPKQFGNRKLKALRCRTQDKMENETRFESFVGELIGGSSYQRIL